jgi:hypothetical protein
LLVLTATALSVSTPGTFATISDQQNNDQPSSSEQCSTGSHRASAVWSLPFQGELIDQPADRVTANSSSSKAQAGDCSSANQTVKTSASESVGNLALNKPSRAVLGSQAIKKPAGPGLVNQLPRTTAESALRPKSLDQSVSAKPKDVELAAEHPFPIAQTYHVLTLSVPLSEEAQSMPAQVSKINQAHATALPVNTLIQAQATPLQANKIIQAHVSAWDGPIDVNQIINYLVDKNFETSLTAQQLDKQVEHFNKIPAKTVAVAKDSLERNLNYQGFDPSMRVGRLILDKKYNVRNNAWAEYERQKYVDQIHLAVVTGMMQIAEGLGMSDPKRREQTVALGQDALKSVVGPEEAEKSVKGLKTWLNAIKMPESSFAQTPWSTIDRNKKLEEVVKAAIKDDPVVHEVTSKLEHYANPGKVKAASAHVIETTLNGIALLGPGFAIPLGAAAIETGLRQSTGGTEENKLEREILFDKRIQSRLKVVSQEAALALDNYRFALVTKNPPLLAFSQEILGNMAGKSNTTKIVSAQPTIGVSDMVPALR